MAIRDDLLRYGIERMLQADGSTMVSTTPSLLEMTESRRANGRFVIVLLCEINNALEEALHQADRSGVKVLVLIKDAEPHLFARVTHIKISGIVAVQSLNEHVLRDAMARMESGEVPIPAELAHQLVALAGRRTGEVPRPRPRFTPREQEVLVLMVDGLSNKQIASRLGISLNGAKRLVANVLVKLDCGNRTLAVAKALREGHYDTLTAEAAS